MYENIIKPLRVWYPCDHTDPNNKADLSFGAHSEKHKIQAHKNTMQMRFSTNFTAFSFPASQYTAWNNKYGHYEEQFVTQRMSRHTALYGEK
ncbi:hypothetical protein GDO81_028742 [Engystomops pustulosus]|uniref:Uncharacterized protein n=1 Tax=Engystomops pustulosus TaxID=76066 RepID=A0AAV6YMZ3_ENGPU|nr:hypothetical protein GDO81_028742 [Engystomops pustulosus]